MNVKNSSLSKLKSEYEVEINLTHNLITLRKYHKLRQYEVANYLNLHSSSYSCYELGRSRPNYETLIRLANLYNVSVQTLLTGLIHPEIR